MAFSLIPSVGRSSSIVTTVNTAIQIGSIARSIYNAFLGPKWGIFDSNGRAVLVSDTVRSIEFRSEYHVSSYPIEEGGFVSFNKVKTPFDVRIGFVNGGQRQIAGVGGILTTLIPGLGLASLITGSSMQEGRRTAFLSALDSMMFQTDQLFTVVTPERSYFNTTLTHYEYNREREGGGASMILVEVWCQEVRLSATKTTTTTELPSGQNAQSTGTVQPQTPSAPVSQAASLNGSAAADLAGQNPVA